MEYFFETPVPNDPTGIKRGFTISERLYSGQSPFQRIEVYDLKHFGPTLVLDGVPQTSEVDEFIYHEMLVHPAMFTVENPLDVLVIGGGDGGAIKEVLRHPVRKVWMVELDRQVVEVCRQFMPNISAGAFRDPRVELIFGDGTEMIKEWKHSLDVIILDLPDPGGDDQDFISSRFYKDVKAALRPRRVVSLQSGSVLEQPELMGLIGKRLTGSFRFRQVRLACVPIYPTGEFTFTLASDTDLEAISKDDMERRFREPRFSLRYWSPDVHLASAVLPKYIRDLL